jgi:hypothetical protein
VTDAPETRYAKTGDGVHVAYQVFGDGPLDVVFMPLGLPMLSRPGSCRRSPGFSGDWRRSAA